MRPVGPLCRLLLLLLVVPAAGQTPDAFTIAITVDEDLAASTQLVAAFRTEIEALMEQDAPIETPDALVLGAGGTLEGARAIHDRLLADDGVDLIVTLGTLVTAEMVARRDLPLPAIAPFAIDGFLSDLPRGPSGGSGVENLTYVEPVFDFTDDIERYRELVAFDRLAVVAAPGVVSIIRRRVGEAMVLPEIGLRVVPVVDEGTAEAVVASLPEATDAVMIAESDLDEVDRIEALTRALTAAGIPSFATLGEAGVRAGALAGLTPSDWIRRLMRRTALHSRRILLGEPAAELPVGLTRRQTFYLNMDTAASLGVSPTFALMSDAQLIGDLQREPDRTFDLVQTMSHALEANRDLQAARSAVEAAREDVGVDVANLLPQLSAMAGGRRIDGDRAESGSFGAETTWTLGVEFSQILWSERAWGAVEVRRHLVDSAEAALRQAELDVALEAATAYFDVLATLAVERIRRENLELTRSNLERARIRERLGAASPAEEYRWQAQVARDQDALVTSIAERNLAEIQLNRVLSLELEGKLGVVEPASTAELLAILDERFLPYMDDPASLRLLRGFVAEESIANSPEIAQIEAALAVQERLGASETRSFYSPDLVLSGDWNRTLERSGAGAEALDAAPFDDDDWELTLGLRLPLFEGGARFAERSRLAAEALRLEREREALSERVRQRARSAVHVASASFTRIGLTQRASEAARRNFELVAAAYAEGAVSIIELLDAQTARFTAEQEASNALFRFVSDVMEVERASGDFVILGSESDKDAVFERLVEYESTTRSRSEN